MQIGWYEAIIVDNFVNWRLIGLFVCRCASGESCVSLQKVCDGVADCSDSGDEASCGKTSLWNSGVKACLRSLYN